MPGKQVYEFGPYRVDVALSRLERAGAAIPLPPKAFDLLVLLARNPDRIVGKSELIDALWPNTFVDDANLTQHVYTLRKALGDQPDGRPYIETAARRGYRLAAAVATDAIAATPTPIPTTTDAERKHATVLHCTVSNAAPVVERFGPEGLRAAMARLLGIALSEIERYEGVVTERHADGFVAVFGAPVVHEDDGRRAVLAALAIRDRSTALLAGSPSDDATCDLQMGIDTGPIVIERIAEDLRAEYTAVGETMRGADRLQQLAQPGDILISETTRRVVEKFVALEAVDVRSAGAGAYRVVALHRRTATSPRTSRMLAPYVGRHDDVALLNRLLASSLAGQGQVISIVGEPGMGKSRLVYEFVRTLNDGAASPKILEGRCVSYGSLAPYLPLADLVRTYCGLDDSDGAETVRRATDRVTRDEGLSSDAGTWLQRLIGVADTTSVVDALSPEAIKARTFDVLRQLILRASARQPLVIVVEDVHWIDRTSEEFLTTLVERLGAARVLLVATHRPGYSAPWMHRSYATQITLAPLTPSDSRRLVASVAGDRALDAEISGAILRRGEGNPFFLEELARAIVEHEPATDAIPETVHGVIMARVDRLAEVPKQLLQTASVIGREVPLGLLERVWAGPWPLPRELDELCRLEFLFERSGGEEPLYVFKHALTQDVAYDSLLARTRRETHLRAARALETQDPDRVDELAATLAYHYTRTDLVAEAVRWLTRAADRATRVYANAEAILHLDLAARRLQRLPEGPDRDRWFVQVAIQQAHSLYFLGRWRESIDVLMPHEARVARLNDVALTAAHAFWLAHMYSRLGDQRRAADCASRAIEAATSAGDNATLGKAHGVLALEGHWAGTPTEGIAHGLRSAALLERLPDQCWWLGMTHFYLALNHILRGDFERALAESARAEDVGKDIGDPRLQTYAGFAVGWVEILRGDHDAAVARCQRSVELAPDRVSRAYASLFVGYGLLEKGDHELARERFESLVPEFEGFAFPQWHAFVVTLLAESCRLLGRLDEADAAAQCGSRIAARAGYGYVVALSYRVAGRIARDRGATEEALRAFQQASDTFIRIGAAFEAARTRAELEGEYDARERRT